MLCVYVMHHIYLVLHFIAWFLGNNFFNNFNNFLFQQKKKDCNHANQTSQTKKMKPNTLEILPTHFIQLNKPVELTGIFILHVKLKTEEISEGVSIISAVLVEWKTSAAPFSHALCLFKATSQRGICIGKRNSEWSQTGRREKLGRLRQRQRERQRDTDQH